MRKTNQRLRMLPAGFWTAVVLTASILSAQARMYSQDRNQGRSMVISRYGIVAAESPLASQAGVQMLERGGNAVDAAIAANAMMGLVAPMSNGIGGDLFAIVYDAKSGKLYGLNASGWAPSGLTIDFFNDKGFRYARSTASIASPCPALSTAGRSCSTALAKRNSRTSSRLPSRLPATAFRSPNGPRNFGAPTPTFFAETRLRPRPIFPIIAPPPSGRSSGTPISRALSN